MPGSPPAGLCNLCAHQRVVRTTRGSSFSLCQRSREDDRFPRYPRLPVTACAGYEPRRCWPASDPLYVAYHDREWGRPVREEPRLLERLCLEGFQSGLSWLTILRKRENFRAAFAGFDPVAIARFGDGDVQRLMGDAGIVRNRAKIEATIANARATVALHEAGETLGALLWSFAPEHAPPAPQALQDMPATTPESKALARELKRRGFRFVGPTTAYALMQATGIVNDHLAGCIVRDEVQAQIDAARSLP
ncbi:MAG: DNA-3-methyladenine glycosylase [Solirubrobacteraceae bacterium]|jgi:DNA-3-methyladenine glycosylase I|nr:DNA-3-methyladenine glycosylase [Solirubrobacteraceae bacterium]